MTDSMLSDNSRRRTKQVLRFVCATAFTVLATRYTYKQMLSRKCMYQNYFLILHLQYLTNLILPTDIPKQFQRNDILQNVIPTNEARTALICASAVTLGISTMLTTGAAMVLNISSLEDFSVLIKSSIKNTIPNEKLLVIDESTTSIIDQIKQLADESDKQESNKDEDQNDPKK
ncbi:hypothetical protein TBLA_0C05180 [Henningerozyma blattae CBS 6284]|uniref:Altered inheritance of mitochondria protein 11 n=1 Tax=Henningerozyma blattae (strain ATCC 34711 / CBS 6284 / DSM 70876 / NBRC 10599 / NRRL Y-10934 / UCD 77-7) TaxID=1071380 RepID=I2H1R2_HENB6|nr:hypothetical protein TBLA_0C05180 [Tetrapisispora blattae CBS 6284]CCH60314.1 hypothetical protein TBLA_0C05180 [Tetrapisispora blattae CBS 6284]